MAEEEKTGDEEMRMKTCGVRAAWQPGREKSDLEKGGTGGTGAGAGAGVVGAMKREKSDISKVVRREKSDLTAPARGVSSRGAGTKSDRSK